MALPRVFPGLPSALLQRRPDIASAQRRVESASAAVGLARRAFFPVFSVGAALGRDSTRADAPLSQAPDAIYLDSTHLSIDEVEEAILKIVRSRVTNGKDFS